MTGGKRKVSLTLDEDLVVAVEEEGAGLSATVNAALRVEIQRRLRTRGLAGRLERMTREDGPLDGAEDLAEGGRYLRLLGGPEPGRP